MAQVTLDHVLAAAEAEGKQVDTTSVAFALGYCAGLRSRRNLFQGHPASNDKPHTLH